MKKKSFGIYLIIIFFFLIIGIRLFFLGAVKNNQYEKLLAQKTDITIQGLSAPRGRIIDTNGKVIVDNKGINTIMYHKIKGISFTEELAIAHDLAKILNVPAGSESDLKKYWLILNDNGKNLITEAEYQLLAERKIKTADLEKLKLERITPEMLNEFSPLDRKIAYIYAAMNKGLTYAKKEILAAASAEECALVSESYLPGVTVEMTWERIYLYDNVMKSILGTVGSIPKEEKDKYLQAGYELTDVVGLSYLEKEYEDYLKGEKALYKVNADNTLTLIKPAQKGHDLVLAIDIDIQKEAEKILQEKILLGKKSYANTEYYRESYALVSDPATGHILAMAGQRLNSDGTFSDVATNNLKASFTIGSAVKGATIAVGYKYHLFEVGKYITDGCVKLNFVPAKCSHKRLGRINDLDALAQSSNYFQFLIAINLTGQKYYPNMELNATAEHFQIYRDMLASFGLGALTEIDLPGEVTGIKGSRIADDLLLNLTIGQYDTYTPLEVIQYINSVASGKRMALSLKKEIRSATKVIAPATIQVLNRVDLDEEYLKRIRLGLNKVLLAGTGKGFVNQALNPVGKTGTSETFIDTDGDGKQDVATITSTFAGYFPFNDPQYSVVVITPNISHHNGSSNTMYYGARRITNALTEYLSTKMAA